MGGQRTFQLLLGKFKDLTIHLLMILNNTGKKLVGAACEEYVASHYTLKGRLPPWSPQEQLTASRLKSHAALAVRDQERAVERGGHVPVAAGSVSALRRAFLTTAPHPKMV